MANRSLCSRCQTMLATQHLDCESTEHHPDGDSFREALRIGCRFCFQLWVQLGQPKYLCHTRYDFKYETTGSPYRVEIYHDDRSGAFNLEDPYETPSVELGNSTNSDQSFQFIASKFSECIEHHGICTKNSPDRYLPQRLIYIGERGQNVTLVDREDISPHSFYATLSHCWGQTQALKLTERTSSKFQSGIELQELPRTFQHAIQATQRLSIKWIWIDSLCIFQDSIDDWSVQASAMQDIYEYAVLNIAATAASDGKAGLFYERNPDELMPFNVETYRREIIKSGNLHSRQCFREMTLINVIDKAPLNRRGWVMQERLLSRRIVHFSKDAVYWECHKLFASEIHPDGIPLHDSHEGELHTKSLKRELDTYKLSYKIDGPGPGPYLYQYWGLFLNQYTSCQLTYRKDRLVAIAGVARRVESVLQDELIAGLWRSRFIEQLCWQTLGYNGRGRSCDPAEPWIAPSWSWASCEYSSRQWHRVWFLESQHLAKLVNVDIQAEDSGALIRGSVCLLCRLVPVKLYFTGEEVDGVNNWMSLSFGCYNGKDPQAFGGLSVHLDGPCFTAITSSPEEVLILPLLEMERRWPRKFRKMAGIVVIPSGMEDGAYRRIGQFIGKYPERHSYHASTELLAHNDGSLSVEERFYSEVMEYYKQAKDEIIKLV